MKKTEPVPCPWCRELPEVAPWHGGGPRKRMVTCENPFCPVGPFVTGSTRQRAIAKWNTRGPQGTAEP